MLDLPLPGKPENTVNAGETARIGKRHMIELPASLGQHGGKRCGIISQCRHAGWRLPVSFDIGFGEVLPRMRIGCCVPAASEKIDTIGFGYIPKPGAERMRLFAVKTGARQL